MKCKYKGVLAILAVILVLIGVLVFLNMLSSLKATPLPIRNELLPPVERTQFVNDKILIINNSQTSYFSTRNVYTQDIKFSYNFECRDTTGFKFVNITAGYLNRLIRPTEGLIYRFEITSDQVPDGTYHCELITNIEEKWENRSIVYNSTGRPPCKTLESKGCQEIYSRDLFYLNVDRDYNSITSKMKRYFLSLVEKLKGKPEVVEVKKY